MFALCPTSRQHRAPGLDCRCGWFGWDDVRQRPRRLGASGPDGAWRLPRGVVSAVARVSGRVIVEPAGIRAAEMRVVAATAHPEQRTAVAWALERDLQGAPHVWTFTDEDAMLAQFRFTPFGRDLVPAGAPASRRLVPPERHRVLERWRRAARRRRWGVP